MWNDIKKPGQNLPRLNDVVPVAAYFFFAAIKLNWRMLLILL